MRLLLAVYCAAALTMSACAPPQPAFDAMAEAPVDMSALVGIWEVSLYFDPDQPPSSTTLEVLAISKGALSGEFYGTPFEVARAAPFNGQMRLSFVTSDSSGPYASAARLMPDGTLSGQTLSTGRNFLMPWTATKKQN